MATMGEIEPRIFRRDATGRVRYSAARRKALLDEFERLGMKGAAFARMAGISYPTFATWIQKRRHARGDYRMRPPAVAGEEMGHAPQCACGFAYENSLSISPAVREGLRNLR